MSIYHNISKSFIICNEVQWCWKKVTSLDGSSNVVYAFYEVTLRLFNFHLRLQGKNLTNIGPVLFLAPWNGSFNWALFMLVVGWMLLFLFVWVSSFVKLYIWNPESVAMQFHGLGRWLEMSLIYTFSWSNHMKRHLFSTWNSSAIFKDIYDITSDKNFFIGRFMTGFKNLIGHPKLFFFLKE